MKKYTISALPANAVTYNESFALSRDDICFFERLHTHDYFEIEYIYFGEGIQVINGVSYAVRSGDVILLSPEDSHSYYSSTDMRIINCCFSENAFSELKYMTEGCDKAVTLTDEDRASFEELLHLFEGELKREIPSETVCKAYLSAICSLFLRNNKSSALPAFWQPIISYTAVNYADITLESAAKRAHLSKNYFCRKFKKDFGVTFTEYTAHLKIQRAKQLLLLSELSVTEIMTRVGYTNSKLFYKNFKGHTGTTPAKYRQKEGNVK